MIPMTRALATFSSPVRVSSTPNRLIAIALLCLLSAPLAWADVICDGVDDFATSNVLFTSFASTSVSTLSLWYKPTGTVSDPGVNECFQGPGLFTNFSTSESWTSLGLHRHPNLGGADRLCGSVFSTPDFSSHSVNAAYTNNAWTHLAHVHTGGTITLYKDGVVIGSTSAGDAEAEANAFLQVCRAAASSGNYAPGVWAEAEVFNVA